MAVSKKEVHPGDTVELAVTFAGENGVELLRTVSYQVPAGAPAGTLQFTVADATTANLTEFQQSIGVQPKSPYQVVSFLNSLRSSNKAYVRVWRTDAAFQVQGSDLPDPPPSVALLLAKSQATPQNSLAGPWFHHLSDADRDRRSGGHRIEDRTGGSQRMKSALLLAPCALADFTLRRHHGHLGDEHLPGFPARASSTTSPWTATGG